jgi:hypothetical protein
MRGFLPKIGLFRRKIGCLFSIFRVCFFLGEKGKHDLAKPLRLDVTPGSLGLGKGALALAAGTKGTGTVN